MFEKPQLLFISFHIDLPSTRRHLRHSWDSAITDGLWLGYLWETALSLTTLSAYADRLFAPMTRNIKIPADWGPSTSLEDPTCGTM